VPLSPVISTVESLAANRVSSARDRALAGDSPIMAAKPNGAEVSVRSSRSSRCSRVVSSARSISDKICGSWTGLVA